MFGASLVKVLKFIVSGTILTGSQLFILLVAMLVAFAVSLYVIRFLTDYVKNHDFTFFGKYRIGLGIFLLFYGLMKVLFGWNLFVIFACSKIEKNGLFLYNEITTRMR